MYTTSIHNYEKRGDRAALIQLLKSAFPWYKKKSILALLNDFATDYQQWRSVIQLKSNETTQFLRLLDGRV